MGDVINLRQARKAKARDDKAQRRAEDTQRARQEAAVDAAYREDRAPE